MLRIWNCLHRIQLNNFIRAKSKWLIPYQTRFESYFLPLLLQNTGKRGIRFLLSNSDVPEAREIYSRFNIKVLEVCRRINSNSTKRSAVNELAVTNYDVATGELLKID